MLIRRRHSPLGETKCYRQVKGQSPWFLIGSWVDYSPASQGNIDPFCTVNSWLFFWGVVGQGDWDTISKIYTCRGFPAQEFVRAVAQLPLPMESPTADIEIR